MESQKNIHKISIAPMMEITNHHYRSMIRLITKETLLYTEMIHHDTIHFSSKGARKVLEFDLSQKPIIVQLGGNKTEMLGDIAGLCKELNYDEINLNCGCPSPKVTDNNFGACLMNNPKIVSECTKKMREISNLEVTVKCRLGLNKFDQEYLNNFISIVNQEGLVNHFIIHARLAIMNLDPVKNRKIPPLQYHTVYNLKSDFPNLLFSINGGIKSLDEIECILNTSNVNGCMIGRAAYENPWIFADVDRRFFGVKNIGLSRKEIIYKYSEYCDVKHSEGVNHNDLFKPLTNLFHGERNSSVYRQYFQTYKKDENIGDYLKTVVDEYEKLNPEVVNKNYSCIDYE